jgi:hypothetical protein
LLVRVLAVLLLVLLVLFSVGGDAGVLFGGDADDAGGNFVVDYELVVFTYDVDTALLGWEVSEDLKRQENGHTKIPSDLSSYGSLSNASGLSRSLLMNVPFDLMTSLIRSAKHDQLPGYIVRDGIREAIPHASDLAHDASFLGFGIIAVAEAVDASTEANEANLTAAVHRFVPLQNPVPAPSTSAPDPAPPHMPVAHSSHRRSRSPQPAPYQCRLCGAEK